MVEQVITFARLSDARRQKNFDRRIPHLISGWWVAVRSLIFSGIGDTLPLFRRQVNFGDLDLTSDYFERKSWNYSSKKC